MIKRGLPTRRVQSFSEVLNKVNEIVGRVKREGDLALMELTYELDKVKLESLILDEEVIEARSGLLPREVRSSIDLIWEQLTSFHELIKPPSLGGGNRNVEYGILWRPLDRVGIYVPGGKRSYPSTLMMAGIPAVIAGVGEIYVATPVKGDLDPATAYISKKLKVKRIYPVGGRKPLLP